MFLERGYHASRITDITAAAGVDSNTVARVFGDKESLLAELVAYVLAGQFEVAEKLVEGKTDDKMLLYAAETTLRIYEVPTERINEAISFVSQFNYPVIAQQVIDNMLGYLLSRT